jgi:alanine dehydrogenase
MPTLFLSKSQVLPLLDMKEIVAVIEEAFGFWAKGKVVMPPKSYLTLNKGDFRAMPAAIPGAAGVKWVNVHPGNPALGLPTVMAVIIYSDPETGYPLAVMDGTEITNYRTGAASAVASKYMARPDSRILGLVGAGRQAYTQLSAHAVLFDLKLIKAYDIQPAAANRLIQAFPQYHIEAHTLQDTLASDIVCTTTPAREPVVRKEWINPGVHINAVGADAPGKQELEPAVLCSARVVVDDMKQATSSGEVNVALTKGLLNPAAIYGTLGELVAGMKLGRQNGDEVTVFDATGLAFEDIACARLVYLKVKDNPGNVWLDFVGA